MPDLWGARCITPPLAVDVATPRDVFRIAVG